MANRARSGRLHQVQVLHQLNIASGERTTDEQLQRQGGLAVDNEREARATRS